MKLVTFEKDGRSAVGLLNAAGTAVHPVPGCADMQTLIAVKVCRSSACGCSRPSPARSRT